MRFLSALSPDVLPRFAACYAGIFFMMFLDIQILPIFADLPIYAIFFLPTIYYWAIYRPTILPPLLLFIAGLIKDLFLANPYIGLTSCLFLAVYLLTKQQRSYLAGQSFIMIWVGYCIVASSTMFVYWLVHCLHQLSFEHVLEFLFETLCMIILFPLILPALGAFNKLLPNVSYNKKGSLL